MIAVGAPVVADVTVWDVLHLPAPTRTTRMLDPRTGRTRDGETVRFDPDRIVFTWPARCGKVGYLYRYAGAVLDASLPFCPSCLEGTP